MQTYNFTKLNTREKKMYAFSDIKLSSQGIPVIMVGIFVGLLVVSVGVNLAIGQLIGEIPLIPLRNNGEIDPTPLAISVAIPLALATALYRVKIQNHKLYELILSFATPKPILDIHGKPVRRKNIQIRAFLER